MKVYKPNCFIALGSVLLLTVTLFLGCQSGDQTTDDTTATATTDTATDSASAEAFPPVPVGMPPVPVPDDNPVTAQKVALGHMLFFDTRLSGDNTIACANCHNPQMGWTIRSANAMGVKDEDGKDQFGDRNTPTIINAAYYEEHFWDGRAPGLEAQATGPIQNPIEMGQEMGALIEELKAVPEYVDKFKEAFDAEISEETIAKALASFERTIISGNSPYDKFKAGDDAALNAVQQRGLELFESVGCSFCHEPPEFSNHQYHNAGVGMNEEKVDEGRKNVTKKDSDLGKFRVPEIRNVEMTGPYFHNGSAKTLEDAVAVMAGGGIDNPNLSPVLKAVRDAELTDEDKAALVEFLKALTGDYPVLEAPAIP
jgi:cytochrome c peroxidase